MKLFLFFTFLTFGFGVAQAEVIESFSAHYTILESSEVKVVETIKYDFEGSERHGLFRVILNKHPQAASAWYKTRFITPAITSVTREGQPENFDIESSGNKINLKIGDADTLLTGKQTYVISYTLSGALSYGADGSEFYYNVTGHDWTVPIVVASAAVHSAALSGGYNCYQGESGETEACTSHIKDESGVNFTANNLQPGQGLTIAAELDPTLVTYVVNERTTWLLFGYGLAFVWSVICIVFAYRFRRKNFIKKTVVAQYEPYQNFLPMYTGYLFDNILDPRDITAGILYLAEQGFIKITKTNKKVLLIIPTTDYDISIKRPLSEVPTNFLTKVSQLLFSEDTTVGTVVSISALAKKRTKNAERILYLKRDLETDLKENGFLESTYSTVVAFIPKVLVYMLVIFGGFIFIVNGFILLFLVLAFTIIVGVIMLIPRKTALWFDARNHTEGFKLFLTVTDKERFDFHNAPEHSPELFMKYLPYAVALGVEEKWSEVFKDITIPQPSWYDGGNVAAFSASNLTNDLGAFSTALSSNSGVSGSSGGGSSGGGGGGGGGGSW